MYVLIYLKPLRKKRDRINNQRKFLNGMECLSTPVEILLTFDILPKFIRNFFSSFSSAVVNNNQLITPLFFSSKLEKIHSFRRRNRKKNIDMIDNLAYRSIYPTASLFFLLLLFAFV